MVTVRASKGLIVLRGWGEEGQSPFVPLPLLGSCGVGWVAGVETITYLLQKTKGGRLSSTQRLLKAPLGPRAEQAVRQIRSVGTYRWPLPPGLQESETVGRGSLGHLELQAVEGPQNSGQSLGGHLCPVQRFTSFWGQTVSSFET